MTDFQPESGVSGSELRIYGSSFNSTTTSNTVEIGGISVTPDSGSTTVLYAQVPSGIGGPVTVRVDDGSGFAEAPQQFVAVTRGSSRFQPVNDSLLGLTEGEADFGDVDEDGDQDLVVMGDDGSSATTTLYRNEGGGEFAEAQTFDNLYRGTVDLVDVTGDGSLDLFLTGRVDGGGQRTFLYPGNGDGTFDSPSSAGVNDFSKSAVDFGDLNGDGTLDLVVSGEDAGAPATRVYTNDGTGTFTEVSSTLTDVLDGTVDLNDVDGDGDRDVLLTGSDGSVNYTEVHLNTLVENGGLGFSALGLGLTGVRSSGSDLGDVDDDGDLDWIVFGDDGAGPVTTLYENDGTGSFAASGTSFPDLLNGEAIFGDTDANGTLDLLLVGADTDLLPHSELFVNDGTGTFARPGAGLAAVKNGTAAFGDYDGDGTLDPYLTGTDGTSRTGTLYHEPLNVTAFTPSPNATSVSTTGTLEFTFNGSIASQSGLVDSIVVQGGQSGEIGGTVSGTGTTTLTYDPSRAFAPGERVTTSLLKGIESTAGIPLDTTRTIEFTTGAASGPAAFPTDSLVSSSEDGARAVAVGDLDGDGSRDLVVGASVASTVTVYENDGSGDFGAGTTVDSGFDNTRDVLLSDLNGDGSLDIVAAAGEGTNSSLDEIRWYANDESGGFGSGSTVASSSPVDDVRSIATGDVDGDGDADLVSASSDNTTIALHENRINEGGGFASRSVDGSADDPRTIFLADMDGDLDLDLLRGSVSSDEVVWYANDGTGSFGTAQTITSLVDTNPKDIHAADLTSNGALDVLVASSGTNEVTLVPNLGGGLFDTERFLNSSADSVEAVHPADIDGDDDLDVLAATARGDSLSTIINEGSGSFSLGRAFERGADGAQDITAADLDGDGALDPVAVSYNDDTVAHYPNIEPLIVTGTTPTRSTVGVDTALTEAVFSFNLPLDGGTVDPSDVQLSGSQSGALTVSSVGVQNDTDLVIEPGTLFHPGEDIAVTVLSDSIGAANGAPLDTSETFSFTANTESGSGRLSPISTTVPDVSESDVDWGDYDGDGDPDVVIAGDSAGTTYRKTSIYENDVANGNGFSPLNAGLTNVDQGDVEWGDVDGDGNLDVIVTGSTGSGGIAEIYEGDGAGGFTYRSGLSGDLPGVYNSSVAWGDYNGDGLLDLALAGQTSAGDTTKVYRNDGGAFSAVSTGIAGVELGAVDWGDMDGDGALDLLVVGTDGSFRYAHVYRNTGGDSFTLVADLATGVEQAAAQWGNYNGDEYPDVVVSGKDGSGSRSTIIYRNNGDGSFTDVGAGVTGVQESALDWGDYNGDGLLDVAVAGDSTGSADGALEIYQNEGMGSFTTIGAGLAGSRLGEVEWGDYDGDGVLDLLVTGRSSTAASTTLYKQVEALQVASTTPSQNATGVDTTLGTINVTFNKTPDTDLTTANDVQVVGSQTGMIPEQDDSVGVSGETIAYEPARRFEPGEVITVSLSADSIAATDGTTLPFSYTFEFTARTAAGPLAFPTDQLLNTGPTGDIETAEISGNDSLDAVVAIQDSAIVWYEGGDVLTESVVTNSLSAVGEIELVDVNGDGNVDIVRDAIAWYENDGSGNFSSAQYLSFESADRIMAVDLNGDGRSDLLADSKPTTVVWYRNTATGDFASADTITTGLSSPEIDAADLNKDGTVDPIITSSDSIAWYPNKGNGTFEDRNIVTANASNSIAAISAADADGDGAVDIIGSNSDETDLYLNDGSGSFSMVTTSIPGPVYAPSFADVNADATPDVVGAPSFDDVNWYENDGTGSFVAVDTIWDEAPSVVDESAVADLDADGDLDVLSGSYGAEKLVFHRNTTIAPEVVTKAASDSTSSQFVAEGAVNPGGLSTNVTFEYGEDLTFSGDTTVTAASSPVSGDDTTGVSATVDGLVPNTTYYYRVAAGNTDGSSISSAQSVTTTGITRVYVDGDATGDSTGTSWADAVTSLQTALDIVAPGDSIWVAAGTYYPDSGGGITDNRRDTSFVLPEGVRIYGGFAGGESSLSERDVDANQTILSGDVDGDGSLTGNSYHVVISPTGTPRETRLDGFTVTHGNADSGGSGVDTDGDGVLDSQVGGGLYVNGRTDTSSVTLANLVVTNNRAAGDGGGLYLDTYDVGVASPEIGNVRFTANTADRGGAVAIAAEAGTSGAGISDPILSNVLFRNNQASGSNSNGGALFVKGATGSEVTPRLVHTTMVENSADNSGGGLYVSNLGTGDSVKVHNSILSGNTASGSPDQINTNSAVGFQHSLVRGSGGSRNWDSSYGGDEGGNIDTAPLLVDAAGGNVHLNWASPVIDAGSQALVPADSADVDTDADRIEAVATDLDGKQRVRGANPDMGVYEGGTVPKGTNIVYADSANGTDTGGSGGSWNQPYRTLQAALAAVQNAKEAAGSLTFGEVWVAQGTYYPDDGPGLRPERRDTSFALVDSVGVYGGFRNGDSFSQRDSDPSTNRTVLSGDITATGDTTGNSVHVVTADDARGPMSRATVLDGFVIRGGNASDSGVRPTGGGLDVVATSEMVRPTLSHLRVEANHASGAAGLYVGSFGGGVQPRLSDVDFVGNVASDGGGIGGGAIVESDGGNAAPQMANVRFLDNRAEQAGGLGVRAVNGGVAEPTLANVLFRGNSAAADSAIVVFLNGSNGTMRPRTVNATWASNGATSDSLSSLLQVQGETGQELDVQVANSIFWGNEARRSVDDLVGGTVVENSVVEGGWSGTGAGNVDADPLYVNRTADSLQVLGNSPALTRGDSTQLPPDWADLDVDGDSSEALPVDLQGGSRILTGQVDAGAYEGAQSPSVAPTAVSNVADSSADLSGVVVPYSTSATVAFEVEPSGGGSVSTYDLGTSVSGTDSLDVSVTADSLEPSTEYVYRVIADDGTRSTTSPADTFATLTVALTAVRDTYRVGTAHVDQVRDTAQVTVENTGEVSLSDFESSLSGAASEDFRVLGRDTTGGGGALQPGEQTSFSVVFEPSATGTRMASVKVRTAEGGSASAKVTGRGVSTLVDAGDAKRGESLPVSVDVEGGYTPGADSLYARKGGATAYRAVPLSEEAQSDGTLELKATIPGELVTSRGVDYFIALSEGGGQSGAMTIPAGGVVQAGRTPKHVSVSFESLEPALTFRSETYRMVSVPAQPEGGIKEELQSSYGKYDRSVWRLSRWDPSEGQRGGYRDYPEVDTLRPGEGFWLVTNGGDGFSIGSGRTVDASVPRRIVLEEGWNQVGTPFGFAVPWDSVLAASSLSQSEIDGPVVYQDSGGYQYGRPRLEPWEGYFVNNLTGGRDTLLVPPVGAGSNIESEAQTGPRALATVGEMGGSVKSPSTSDRENGVGEEEGDKSEQRVLSAGAKVPDKGSSSNQTEATVRVPKDVTSSGPENRSTKEDSGEKGDYTLQLEAQSGEESHHVWLGLRSEAELGRDRFDFSQPPPIGQSVRMSLNEEVDGRTVPHAGSFKPPEGEGQVWTLLVENEDGDESSTTEVRLRLRTHGSLPKGHQRFLLDLDEERRLPPGKWLELEGGERRHIKVILGTRAFAEKESGSISIEKFENELRGNYPNPFGRETTIEYVLEAEQEVSVTVYNVLGQRVRTLVEDSQRAGIHTVRWRGKNRYGDPVGSGVYFYRIEATGFSETRKMMLVR